MHRLLPPFALSLVLVASALPAATLDDFHTWASVSLTGTLGGAWRYGLEGHARYGDDSSRYGQGLLRPGVGYALSPQLSLWAGYAFIASDLPFAARQIDEHRAWQQILYAGTTPLGSYNVRTRIEQRHLETGGELGWRLRQQFRFVHPLPVRPRTSLVLWDEAFVHLNDTDWGVTQGFDQNRAFVGIGEQFAPHLRAEVGYLHHYVNRTRATDRVNHVLWLSLAFSY